MPTDFDATDDIQSSLNAASKAATAREIKLPVGRFVITDTLRIKQTMGMRFGGSGGPNRSPSPSWDRHRVSTILDWRGPADKPVLHLDGCCGTVIEGLNIVCTAKASHGVLITHGAGSLNLAFRDCGFMGMAVGIQCGESQGEQTCANIQYSSCIWENLTDACVRLMNLQSLEHDFDHPKFIKTPIGIDVVAGGDVSVRGGGSYDMGCLMRLGNVASNCRGFDWESFRVDGDGKRTKWLVFADKKTPRTYGAISFSSCAQNSAQLQSDGPLVEVAPGSRVILEKCGFHAEKELRAGMLGHVYSTDKAAGELIVNYCDGIGGQFLSGYATMRGSRSFAEYTRCGTLWGETASWSNFPKEAVA